MEQARLYDEQGADELVFLDISATHEGRKTTLELVSRVAETVFMPLTVGGGIREVDDMRNDWMWSLLIASSVLVLEETRKLGARILGKVR